MCWCLSVIELKNAQWNIEKNYISLFCFSFFFLFYFVLWPTNAQLFHKLSRFYMFRHCRVILRQLVINTLPSYASISNASVCNRTCIKPLWNILICKLYYQQLHLKYLCNLARYWLQAPWGWHDSVETCSSVIICEIIVHLLVIVQNNEKCTIQALK